MQPPLLTEGDLNVAGSIVLDRGAPIAPQNMPSTPALLSLEHAQQACAALSQGLPQDKERTALDLASALATALRITFPYLAWLVRLERQGDTWEVSLVVRQKGV